jgi:hypothetical protein
VVSAESLPLPDPRDYELPHQFMLRNMNNPNLTLELRIRIAQALLPYYAIQQRHIGKKDRKQEAADEMVDDRFERFDDLDVPQPYAPSLERLRSYAS